MAKDKRTIMIATPAYGGNISVSTAVGVIGAIDEGRQNGWDVRFLPLIGGSDIADTRNQILGLFWKAGIDDLLFLDSDVGFFHGTFTHIMRHDVDLVAGVYCQRRDLMYYPVRWPDKRNMIELETGPLLEAAGVPAGFLRIRRSCLEKMLADPDVKWIEDKDRINGCPFPFLFDWEWDGKMRLSEDFSFCERFRRAGGQVWIDPSLKLDHVGLKIFKGDFMEQIKDEVEAHEAAA